VRGVYHLLPVHSFIYLLQFGFFPLPSIRRAAWGEQGCVWHHIAHHYTATIKDGRIGEEWGGGEGVHTIPPPHTHTHFSFSLKVRRFHTHRNKVQSAKSQTLTRTHPADNGWERKKKKGKPPRVVHKNTTILPSLLLCCVVIICVVLEVLDPYLSR